MGRARVLAGLFVAAAALAGAEAPTALAQATSGAPAPTNDAATDTGERVDPAGVRAVGASKIPRERAAEIANTLMATAPARAAPMSAEVGAPLPGDVDVQPLPPSVTDLAPEYRGFAYAVGNDRVAIVKPSTRQVVEVITAGRARP